MKNPKLYLFVFCSLFLMTACQKEDPIIVSSSEKEKSSDPRTTADDTHLIVLAAPSVYNNYYAEIFEDIIDYQINFAKSVEGRDEVVILVDQWTRPYFQGKLPDHLLINANMEDIWIRDYASVIPGKEVKFNFLPDYMSRRDANFIDNSFERWFKQTGLSYGKKSKLILDGGNVVDNGKDRVVVTDRFLYDNPSLTKRAAKKKLKQLLEVQEVAIIPEEEGDATGHADGMLMWATDNKILLQTLSTNRLRQQVKKELRTAFPGVEIVELPDYYVPAEWKGFSSACDLFVNSIVTDHYIYMPTFGNGYDDEMLQMISQHTDKEVVPIPAEGVCFMGGSVRCLSWQMKGANALQLLNVAGS